MYEAVLRIDGDGAYENATDGTATTIELWCNDHCDLLQVEGVESGRVLDHVRSTVGIEEKLEEDGTQVLITEDCLIKHLDNNIEKYLARHECLLVPPLKYKTGEKWARVLSIDADALSAFYRDLNDVFTVEVETKRAIKTVSPDSPFGAIEAMLPDLTPRQRSVFMTAYNTGYYEIPRETSTEAIAESEGINRRTAEDHLRRAEKRIAAAIIEYL